MEISVIIPVFNKGAYLQSLLDDLRRQSFHDYECLLIDDGSTDQSAQICDQFAQQDQRFHVVHIPNGGVSRARNLGLQQAKGRYLTFIDGDDRIAADYLLHLHQAISESHADMVIGGLARFGGSQDLPPIVHPSAPANVLFQDLLPGFAAVQQETGIYGYCIAKLFPRELVKDLWFDPDFKLAEDFEFYLRLYPRIHSVRLDDHTDYRYRQEAEQSWMQLRDDQIDYVAQLRINLRYRAFLVEACAFSGENQQLVEQKINNYLYFSLFHCPKELLDERFRQLRRICEEAQIQPQGDRGMQKICLAFLRKNCSIGVKTVLGTYRFLRRIRNTARKFLTTGRERT